MSLYCKDMVEPYYIRGIQKQPFLDVSKIFLKILQNSQENTYVGVTS